MVCAIKRSRSFIHFIAHLSSSHFSKKHAIDQAALLAGALASVDFCAAHAQKERLRCLLPSPRPARAARLGDPPDGTGALSGWDRAYASGFRTQRVPPGL